MRMHPAAAPGTTAQQPTRPATTRRGSIEIDVAPDVVRDFELIAALFGVDAGALAAQVLTDYVHRQRRLADDAAAGRAAGPEDASARRAVA